MSSLEQKDAPMARSVGDGRRCVCGNGGYTGSFYASRASGDTRQTGSCGDNGAKERDYERVQTFPGKHTAMLSGLVGKIHGRKENEAGVRAKRIYKTARGVEINSAVWQKVFPLFKKAAQSHHSKFFTHLCRITLLC